MLLVPYFNHETDHGKYAANKNIYRNNILMMIYRHADSKVTYVTASIELYRFFLHRINTRIIIMEVLENKEQHS